MRENRAKRTLAAGGTLSVINPQSTSAGLVEMLGHMGFDAVFIDCEHGSADWEEVEHLSRAAELSGMTPIARVQSHDPAIITRTLDRGVGGIQAPHVNTRAEAEAVVRGAKYAPLGIRGFAGGRAALGYSLEEYARRANEETLVIVMLEEAEALANLDAILQVENIDVFFIAPSDLAQSMGHPGRADHPDVQRAIDDGLVRIRAAGRVAGTLVTPASVGHYRSLGVQFLYVSLSNLLAPSIKDFLAAAR
jgi:4-hydroxy-2-oxoheptanedioate aldolase